MATARKTKSGSARATTDHDEIREWVERHGGEPAIVKRTRGSGRAGESGILRIDFPGYSGEGSLEAIPWEDFFERFEKANLAFLYQEQTGRGSDSRFNKLVSRDSIDAGESGSARKAGSRGTSPSKTKGSSTRGQKAANDSDDSGEASPRRRSAGAGSSAKSERAQSSSKIAKDRRTAGRTKTAARMGATSRTKKSAKKTSSRSRAR